MELTEIQYETFLKLANTLNVDEPTKKLCLQYYLQYKAVLSQQNKEQAFSEDKVGVVMRCAFFLSEKSQLMYNVKGERIRGVSLSLSQTLKSNGNLDEFVFFLKDIVRKIHLEDNELEAEINQFAKKFCFILTFYNKFESTFKKLDFQQTAPRSEYCRDYMKTLMSFGWLLFIDSKARLFKHTFQIIDVTCLMVSVFRFLIFMSMDFVKPNLYSAIERQSKTPQSYKQSTHQALLQQFKIRDTKMFQNINSHFESYANNILNQDFRYGAASNDILSPYNISISYKKLDATYQKTLIDPEDIDERYFLRERVCITPSRFTPFGGRCVTTKWKKQNFNSQRILNYEMDQTLSKESLTKQAAVTIKIPKNLTPNLTKPPVIFSTPMTQAMEMYNWIAEKPKKQKTTGYFDKIIDKILALQKKGSDPKSKQNRRKLIQNLYQDCLATYPLGNQDSGLLCWCIETVYFVLNLPGLPLKKLSQTCEVQWYHLWRVTDYFLRYDKSMPNALKMHILDLQTRIVSIQLWREETQLINIFNSATAGKLTKKFPQSQRFTRRMLHQLAYQVHLITTSLSLPQQLTNTIFSTLQHILTNQSGMLLYHHLDQLVLCSTYSLSKVLGMSLKFNQIIQKYRQANGYTKQIYNQIIQQVHTPEGRQDIIVFYNRCFIPTMKTYMSDIKTSKNTLPNTGNQPNTTGVLNLLGSPIKSLIPKQLLNIRPSSILTPQTQMLYAYNQSPLLRTDTSSQMRASSFLPSKKLLNFEQQLEETSKRKNTDKAEGFTDIQDSTNDFINKKFNAKKKQNIIQNGERLQLQKQGSGYLNEKLMRIKSKQRL